MTEEKSKPQKAKKPRFLEEAEDPGTVPGFDKPLYTGHSEGHVLHTSEVAN